MRSSILWLAAFAMVASIAAEPKKIVCYYGRPALYRPEPGTFVVEDIDAKLCTHIIYGFMGMSDYEIRTTDSYHDLPDGVGLNGFGRFLLLLSKTNPKPKAMVAIGGYAAKSSVFSDMVSKPSSRATFVRSVVEFLNKWKFEGLDVVWEFPAQGGGHPEDKNNFSSLLKELKDAFGPKGYILSAAVAGPKFSASQSYDIPEISKHLDFISLRTYGFQGSSENRTGHVSPLYQGSTDSGPDKELTVDASVDYWLSEGAPADKLVVGVPFIGRTFTLENPENHNLGDRTVGPGKPGPYTKQPGSMSYNEICEKGVKEPGKWTTVFDTVGRGPYTYGGDQWIGHENADSVRGKAEYVRNKGLGGAMVWSIDSDDFNHICGPRYPLLNALENALHGE